MQTYYLTRDIFVDMAGQDMKIASNGLEVRIVEDYGNGTLQVQGVSDPNAQMFFVGWEDLELI